MLWYRFKKLFISFQVTLLNNNNNDNYNNNNTPRHFSLSSIIVNNKRKGEENTSTSNKDNSIITKRDIELREGARWSKNKSYTVTFAGVDKGVVNTKVNSHSSTSIYSSSKPSSSKDFSSPSTDRKQKIKEVEHQEKLVKGEEQTMNSDKDQVLSQVEKESFARYDDKKLVNASKGNIGQGNKERKVQQEDARNKNGDDARKVALRCSKSPVMVSQRLDKVKNQLNEEKV